jgi:hypothetical protein
MDTRTPWRTQMKIEIITKGNVDKIIDAKLRKELNDVYKQLNDLRKEMIRLNDMVRLK